MTRRALLLLGTGLLLAGCGGRSQQALNEAMVVATTPQVADLVRNVAGDAVVVHQVVKPGIDPHEFEPSPADQEAIRSAKAIFESGLGLETWLAATVRSAGAKAPVVDTSAGIPVRKASAGSQARDPHIWQDPRDAKAMVANIAHGLAAALPDQAAGFASRAAAYSAQLDALDAEVQAQIDTIAPQQRKLVTNHDALGYYADRYGITVVGSVIPSFDSQAELSSRQLADLVASIRAQGVKAIFTESSLPPKAAATVARDAGVTVVTGADALYADSMGAPGSDGDTYLKMIRHNTRQLVAHLA